MNYRALILSLGILAILSLPLLFFGWVELRAWTAWHFREPPPCEPDKARSVHDARWTVKELIRAGERESAFECLKVAAALQRCEPIDRRILLYTASELFGEAEGAKLAVQTYTAALEADPVNYHHLVHRGDTYAKLRRLEEARRDLDAAIATHPDHSLAYRRRAVLLADAGEEEAALEDYTRALEREHDDVFSLLGRGNLYRRLGRYTEAEDDYMAALEIELPDVQVAWVLRNRGYLKELTGNIEAAKADYRRVLELKPDDEWTLKRVRKLIP